MKLATLILLALLNTKSNGQSVPCTSPIKTGVTATSYTDSAVADSGVYFYAVAAVDSNGNQSSCTSTVSAAIPSTGTHTVALSWTASTTSGVTYSVFRAQAPAPPTGLVVVVN